MSKRDKVVNDAKKQKHETVEQGDAKKNIAGPIVKAHAWANVQKLPGGGKMEARRKLPSGPLGGSGRKTNVSRSS